MSITIKDKNTGTVYTKDSTVTPTFSSPKGTISIKPKDPVSRPLYDPTVPIPMPKPKAVEEPTVGERIASIGSSVLENTLGGVKAAGAMLLNRAQDVDQSADSQRKALENSAARLEEYERYARRERQTDAERKMWEMRAQRSRRDAELLEEMNHPLDKPIETVTASAQENRAAANEAASRAMQGLEGAGAVAVDTALTIGNMIPAIGASIITKSPAVGASIMGLTSGGNDYLEQLAEGKTEKEAALHGTITGGLEGLTQYVLGGISKLGGVAKIPSVTNKIGAMNRGVVKALAQLGVNTASEITEEEIQLFLQPLVDTVMYDEAYDVPTVEEMIYTALITALSTGVLEAPTAIATGNTPSPTQAMEQQNAEISTGPDVEIPNSFDAVQGTEYNEENAILQGGRANETDELYQNAGRGIQGIPGDRLGNQGDAGGRNDGRGDLQYPVNLLSDEAVEQTEDTEFFSKALTDARNSDVKNGWAVTPKTEEELTGTKMITRKDGTAGLAVAADGDIEAVFRNAKGKKGALSALMPKAIETGGTKLDCYGEGLVRVYETYGFRPVCRVEFNPEYANPGWDKSKGAPYIYFMVATDRSGNSVRENAGKYNRMTTSELNALPTFGKDDYDKAYAYRDGIASQIKAPQTDGLGAADAGFDPFTQAELRYGTQDGGVNAVRPDDVPVSTDGTTKVSEFAVSAKGAQITPDEFVPLIENKVMEGKFSFVPITNNETTERAKNFIMTEGWDGAVRSWESDLRENKSSAETTAIGALLYNNAVNKGDKALAMEILGYMRTYATNTAQSLQAFRIFKALTPEDQLYSIQKSIDTFLRDADNENAIAKENEMPQKDIEEAASIVNNSRESAAKSAKNAAAKIKTRREKGRVVVEGNQAGEPFVFEYAQKVGEALAKGLEAKRNRPKQQETFLQNIVAELKRFASEKMPKEAKTKPLTAIDLLRDYIQNQEFYSQAWQAAQVELREKYANDPILGEFINSGIGFDANNNPQNAIFMRALVKAAADSGETKSVLQRQEALGFTGMSNTIANNLIEKTGASGEMAQTIKDAAYSYVYDVLAENNVDNVNLVDSAIRSAMKDIGITIEQVVMSGNNEAATAQIVKTLVGKYGFGAAEATATADIVSDRFAAMSKNYAEKRLASMFKDRRSERKSFEKRFEGLARLGAFDIDSKYNQAATERLLKSGVPVRISNTLANRYLRAKTDNERADVIEEISKEIGAQLPVTTMDKWNALRVTNMLGNLKTQLRNIGGNTLMTVLQQAKNAVSIGMQNLAYALSGGRLERTRGLPTKKLISLGRSVFDDVADIAMGEGRYSLQEGRGNFGNDVLMKAMNQRRIFNNSLLEGYRRKTNELMEKGDEIFSRINFSLAFASYLKAHNVTAEMYNDPAWQADNTGFINKALNFAIKDAQEATFRDKNWFSQMASRFGRGKNVPVWGQVISEGFSPFRRTPANVAVRAEEYSPLGVINTAVKAAKKAKGAKDANGNAAVTGADIVDQLAKTLSGSLMAALGFFLYKSGNLTAGDDGDENQQYFDELQGKQNMAFVMDDGSSYTIDWATPVASPLLMGAEFAKLLEEGFLGIDDAIDVLQRITDPILNQAMLQGINDAIDMVQYEGGFLDIATNLALNYAMQGLTNSLLGQIERTSEEVRMMNYTTRDSLVPTEMQRQLGKASAKTPVWEFQQVPYIDAWGRMEESGSLLGRAFENFISPGYSSEQNTTALERELQRLVDANDDITSSLFPDNADKSFKVKGETKYLTPEEYVEYATAKGQDSRKYAEDLLANELYRTMTDEQKASAISKAFEFANAEAKEDVSDYTVSDTSWINSYRTTDLPLDEYLLLYEKYGSSIMGKRNYPKTKAMEDAGVSISEWAAMKEALPDDPLKKEVEAYINTHFAQKNRRQIFEIYKGSRNWKNPY